NYRWRKDGLELNDAGNVSGSQTAALSLSNASALDNGAYLAVVSDGYGSATSQVASVTVLDPVITTQPVSLKTNLGQSVAFSAQAFGTAPLSLQWRRDGTSIAGATNASLSLINVQPSDAAAYDLLASNRFGVVTSAVALLTINLSAPDSFN